jgi:hypothetical protein
MASQPAPLPHLGLAVLCQAVSRQPDGSMDLLGIIEGVVLDPPPPSEADPLGLRPVAVLPLRLVVTLRAAQRWGRHAVEITGRYPGGRPGPSTGLQIELSEARPNATLNVPIDFEVHDPGTCHFDVAVDGALLTTVPLRVVFAEAS